MPPPDPVPGMLYVENDGTGVPVRASQTAGRPGRGQDGSAGTREVKLARFFTVSRLDEDGTPVTDPGSSSYVAAFDGKDTLARLVEAEYLRRGGEHFRQIGAPGDGAAWIWTMAAGLYPHATTSWTSTTPASTSPTWPATWHSSPRPGPVAARPQRRTRRGNIDAIITAARAFTLAGGKAEELDKKLGYFERNAHRMR